MRKSIALAVLFLCATPVLAQGSDQISEGYGTRVNITYAPIDPDYLGVETLGTLHDPALNSFPVQSPVWSPDGRLIAFSNLEYIFLVPAEGGVAEMKYASVYLYPYNGSNIILYKTINKLIGFSPDGKTLYFMHNIMDEESGTVITVTEITTPEGKKAASININMGQTRMALASLDIETGEEQTLVRNVGNAVLSHSGKYLLYCDCDGKTIRVDEIESGEGWDVPLPNNFGFTFTCSADERYIIYSGIVGERENQLFRMPIMGGVSEQLTSYKGGDSGYCRANPFCSANGEWIFHDDIGREQYSNDITSPDGKHHISYNKSDIRMFAFNVQNHETIGLFPASVTIDTWHGQLSPDGKQICYIRKDIESFTDRSSIYIKDLQLPDGGADQQLVVSDAAPRGFSLTGNYPNPFNPSTAIGFTLPETGHATLSIYSVTGQKICTLISGVQSAGAHSVVWDGKDDQGISVSSGAYISRLESGNTVRTAKMLLRK
ncbi:MAG: FlgD immunoglobulin-like domain containing protein [Candidatus Latescibacterota bacterium]